MLRADTSNGWFAQFDRASVGFADELHPCRLREPNHTFAKSFSVSPGLVDSAAVFQLEQYWRIGDLEAEV